MILLLHNRYRIPGGEERAVSDLQWLIPSQLGEEVTLLERDSGGVGVAAAARGLLGGGLDADEVFSAVRDSGARVLHAHNVHPTFGYRALEAARRAGARVVLHLHNYRLVCAVGVCFTQGEDCARCHGRWTWPGVRLNCRDASRTEAVVYGVGLARQQRRIVTAVDHFVVPSRFALDRLRRLGAPVGENASVIPSVQREFASRSSAAEGSYVLYAGRLTLDKGAFDAVAACRLAGLPLVVAGEGPAMHELAAAAEGADVRFTGRVFGSDLDVLRREAAVAVVPSRYQEILPLAALEAMSAGLPVVATRSGGLTEIVPDEGLAPIGDIEALADRLRALFGDASAGERALAVVRERCSPEHVASRLRAVYDG